MRKYMELKTLENKKVLRIFGIQSMNAIYDKKIKKGVDISLCA